MSQGKIPSIETFLYKPTCSTVFSEEWHGYVVFVAVTVVVFVNIAVGVFVVVVIVATVAVTVVVFVAVTVVVFVTIAEANG